MTKKEAEAGVKVTGHSREGGGGWKNSLCVKVLAWQPFK